MAIIDLFKIVDLKEKINERFGIKMHVHYKLSASVRWPI